jgi:hypothetical protein
MIISRSISDELGAQFILVRAPKNSNFTSSLTLLIMYFMTTNSNNLDRVQTSVFIIPDSVITHTNTYLIGLLFRLHPTS